MSWVGDLIRTAETSIGHTVQTVETNYLNRLDNTAQLYSNPVGTASGWMKKIFGNKQKPNNLAADNRMMNPNAVAITTSNNVTMYYWVGGGLVLVILLVILFKKK